MPTKPRLLMCPPDHYGVNYVINPWMRGNVGRAERSRARSQWDQLYETLSDLASIELIDSVDGLPDMVFTANAGLVCNGAFVPSRFRNPQREGELPYATKWFDGHNFTLHALPGAASFEGEGDALFQPNEPLLWAGYGVRTDLQVYRSLAEWLGIEVKPLRLIDERFYHLDTCFAPFPGGRCVYYPDAFDHESLETLRAHFPDEQRFEVGAEDALAFACNAIAMENSVVLSHATDALRARLESWGFAVKPCPLGEFILAGGAAKCLVLRLDNAVETPAEPVPPQVCQRSVDLQGQLLDTGLLNTALDTITELGGTFEFERFQPGLRHDEASTARLRVVAPNTNRLDTILSALLEFGAKAEEAVLPATLEPAPADGVAPRHFYATSIYPTDILVDDDWIGVDKQRMDAVIVVDCSGGRPQVGCRIIRDLREGDRVVCGADGVRVHKSEEGQEGEHFEFMGAAVSSERRVEVVIDQIAWEMQQIRAQEGKIVVVAGPVVVHTGGAAFLTELIEAGYVQSLLGGNAIAVHDIEYNLLGTSLGVDLTRGKGVPGGHRHHLHAINEVRRAGSIKAAVEAGIIGGGIMHACVKHEVPFCLAGSIRDDGPLPETMMDLVAAQACYQEHIRGADMVLMLSSMLHAIATGNMTPAGVRLICVDINPAVVTKLTDRGSLESLGVVTDVGLFLNLLTRRLRETGSPTYPVSE